MCGPRREGPLRAASFVGDLQVGRCILVFEIHGQRMRRELDETRSPVTANRGTNEQFRACWSGMRGGGLVGAGHAREYARRLYQEFEGGRHRGRGWNSAVPRRFAPVSLFCRAVLLYRGIVPAAVAYTGTPWPDCVAGQAGKKGRDRPRQPKNDTNHNTAEAVLMLWDLLAAFVAAFLSVYRPW